MLLRLHLKMSKASKTVLSIWKKTPENSTASKINLVIFVDQLYGSYSLHFDIKVLVFQYAHSLKPHITFRFSKKKRTDILTGESVWCIISWLQQFYFYLHSFRWCICTLDTYFLFFLFLHWSHSFNTATTANHLFIWPFVPWISWTFFLLCLSDTRRI